MGGLSDLRVKHPDAKFLNAEKNEVVPCRIETACRDLILITKLKFDESYTTVGGQTSFLQSNRQGIPLGNFRGS